MIPNLSAFARSYLTNLRGYLDQGACKKTTVARTLGERAVTLGLETLGLANIHEQSLIKIIAAESSAKNRDAMIRRASVFFAETLTPIERTHRGARESSSHLKVMIASLTQRTKELVDSNEELRHEIAQRKAAEESLRLSEQTSIQLLGKSRQMQEELRLLSRRLLSVQEEERRRISRELHDVIAQALTGINVRLASLKKQTAANTKGFHKKIEMTQRMVEKSVDIVHRFARDLRPAMLDDLGLIPALQSYMKGFMEETGIRVTCTAFAAVEQLDNGKRTVLYRIAQEALSNVAQHAQASHAEITLSRHKDRVKMEVHDNGKGFEVNGLTFTKSSKRLGLLGMRERMEMIGGTFCVESSPGHETTVRVEIPCEDCAIKKRSIKSKANTSLECP
jgi:signal transduction histidine kinase